MFRDTLPIDEIDSHQEISTTVEIPWPPVADLEEETEWVLKDFGEKGTNINWSSVAMLEKGKSKANGAQAFSPVGLKVLVVDDNRVCLAVLEKMLNRCKYIVTTCNSAAMALSLVQDKSTPFDLVLCDVHMPGMDGFKLLEALEAVRELPVIMMSSDDETDVVMKGISKGACDYFLKPVNIQRLRTLWQHVFRRREMIESVKDDDCDRDNATKSDRDNSRKRKGKEEVVDDAVDFVNGNKKKTRLVWTSTLHKQFVDAVTVLGTSNAVPKQILEKMNVKGISRENVASHLQKYRKYLIDQETLNEEAKDSGREVVNEHHQGAINAYLSGGHFGSSVDAQSDAISTLLFDVSSVHSPNTISSFHSPNTMSSLLSPNTLSSLHSPNTMSSLQSPKPISSLHSSGSTSSHRSPNTMQFLGPNTMSPHLPSIGLSSLHLPDTVSSLHSADAIISNTPRFTDFPRHNSPFLHNPHQVNLPSDQTMSSFPSSRTAPSLQSYQTMPSFPSDRTVPSHQSAQSLSSGYSVNTELYPVPSQSFQAVETGNFRSCTTPDPLLPSLDVASNSNFSNRSRLFPSMVDAYAPTLVAPAFYNAEYL